MDNPGFVKSTAAKKLNDSVYWGLVCHTYFTEPTCGYTKANVQRSFNQSSLTIDNRHKDSSVNFVFECPVGCKNSCCSSFRRLSIANNANNGKDDTMAEESTASSLYFVGQKCTNGFYNDSYHSAERITVGGSGGCGLIKEKYQTDAGVIESGWTKHNLLCQCGGSYASTSPRFTDYSPESLGVEINDLNFNPMQGCRWPVGEALINKEPMNRLDNEWKNSYSEIDRLARAFDDAQKFVDSLGKVPGMVGLGLMDPTQSPYFRANRLNPVDQSSEIMNAKKSMQLPMINPQCGGPCNPHIKSMPSTSPWIKATPSTISISDRGGIVREAISPQKQDVKKKSEQTIEICQCGETNCRSKHAKINNHESSINKIENDKEIDQIFDKHESRTEHKNNEYRRRRRHRRTTCLNGDEFFKNRRRNVNYVYFAGDSYPRSVYGHKNCSERYKRVPANMGWLWTQYQPIGQLKPRVGWSPGAISRKIREMIEEAKAGFEGNRRKSASAPSTWWIRERKLRTRSHASLKEGQLRKLDEKEEELQPPPTLHIQRRSGAYYITMYPIKKEILDVPNVKELIKPLQFTIPKISDDSSVGTSSIASVMDIKFSPPAAVNRYKKKPNVIHVEIQVNQQDINDTLKLADTKEAITDMKVKKRNRKQSKKRLT